MAGRSVVEDYERRAFPTRSEWRAWLARHHDETPGVWLVYEKKGSDHPSVRYDEAVEEALCIGWIDSRVVSVDDRRYRQLFTPRRPGSIWSQPNKRRAERMIAAGLMTEAGLAVIARAREDGSWSILDQVDALELPADLAEALEAEPDAGAGFDRLPDSAKRQALYWVLSARRPTTRAMRVGRVVAAAREGRLPVV